MMNYCTNKILAFAKIPHLHWDVPGDEATWSWRERSAFRLLWMLLCRVVPRGWLKHMKHGWGYGVAHGWGFQLRCYGKTRPDR